MGVEPNIRINGRDLNEAQAMTVRVAIETFALDLSDPESLGNDRHGVVMRAGYLARIEEIRNFIFRR